MAMPETMTIATPSTLHNASVEAARDVQLGQQTFNTAFEQQRAGVRAGREDEQYALQREQQVRAKGLQDNLDKLLPENASTLDLQTLADYTGEVGADLPTGPDGKLDMSILRRRLAASRAVRILGTGAAQARLTPQQEALLEAYKKNGKIQDAFDENGNLKSNDRLVAGMPSVDLKTEAEIRDSIATLENRRAQMLQAERIINDPTVNSVGPAVGSGPGKFATWLGAAVGMDPKKFENQRQLEIASSQGILEAAGQMKGALSDKDIAFLRASVPQLSDTEALWHQYINKFNAATARAIENRKRQLTGEPPDLSPIIDDAGNLSKPAAGANPTRIGAALPAPGPGAPAIDYSFADKQPPLLKGYPNSALLRGTLTTTKQGQPAILTPDGKAWMISDRARTQILQLRQSAGLVKKAPGDVPTVPPAATPKPLASAPVQVTPERKPGSSAWGALLQAGVSTSKALVKAGRSRVSSLVGSSPSSYTPEDAGEILRMTER